MALLCAALLALALAPRASACTCVSQSAEEALERADGAIAGRLVAVRPRGEARADFRYRVLRVYRGEGIEAGRMLTVRSARSSAACGLPDRLGRRYGLLLMRGAGRWLGGSCGVMAPRRLRAAAERGSMSVAWRC